MTPRRTSIAPVAILPLLLVLAGCSLMDGPWAPKPPPAPPVPVVPQDPPPQAMHRFEIDHEQDDLIGAIQVTKASKEDTLSDIARRFNVGYEEIVRANPKVDPWLPGEGREIIVPTQQLLPNAPREGVVINVAAMRLYYFPKREPGQKQVVYTHPIGIGKVGWATPQGTTRVVRKAKDPTWRPGPGVRAEHKKNGEILPAVVPPGPDNPLGTRARCTSAGRST
jgi:L,D-transpeptidase ErfK/SrfK